MSRLVDPGALFAGWVGVGVAVMIAIGLELILAVQSLVFLAAPLAGLLVGWYANARSERRRPVGRVVANAVLAGAMTGLSLAILYAGLRLLFIYADNGYPDFNQPGRPACAPGPACTYARYVAAGEADELAASGVTDAPSFEGYMLRAQLNGGLGLVGLTLGGAMLAGGLVAAGGRWSRTEAAAVPG
jgi:hypothetical protein